MVLNSLQPKVDRDKDMMETFRIRGEIEEQRIEEVLAMDVNTKDFYATTNYGEVVKLTFDQVMVMPPSERRQFINFMNMKSAQIVHLSTMVASDGQNTAAGTGNGNTAGNSRGGGENGAGGDGGSSSSNSHQPSSSSSSASAAN